MVPRPGIHAGTAIIAAASATMIAAASVIVVTVGDGLLRRRINHNGLLCGSVSSAVLGLMLGLWRRHLHLRLCALDLALLVVTISTTTVASAVIVGECLQRTSAEKQARYGERGDDRQSAGSGHYLPSGTTLIQP